MLRRVLIACFICSTVFAGQASSSAYLFFTGSVISRDTFYGPLGAVKEIMLVVDTHDGEYWTIRCRQTESNLSKCNDFYTGDSIAAQGKVEPWPGLPLGSVWISLTLVPQP